MNPHVCREAPVNTQVNVILPVDLGQKLRDLAWMERKSTSALCRELLRQGIELREEKEQSEAQPAAATQEP